MKRDIWYSYRIVKCICKNYYGLALTLSSTAKVSINQDELCLRIRNGKEGL